MIQAVQVVQDERLDYGGHQGALLESEMVQAFSQIFSCGQNKLYGCQQAISATGLVFESLQFYPQLGEVLSMVNSDFSPSLGGGRIFAIPVFGEFSELWFGGTANLTRP